MYRNLILKELHTCMAALTTRQDAKASNSLQLMQLITEEKLKFLFRKVPVPSDLHETENKPEKKLQKIESQTEEYYITRGVKIYKILM